MSLANSKQSLCCIVILFPLQNICICVNILPALVFFRSEQIFNQFMNNVISSKTRCQKPSSNSPPYSHTSNPTPIHPILLPYIQPYSHIPNPTTIHPTLLLSIQPYSHTSNPTPIHPTLLPYIQPYSHTPNPTPIHSPLLPYTPPYFHTYNPTPIHQTLLPYIQPYSYLSSPTPIHSTLLPYIKSYSHTPNPTSMHPILTLTPPPMTLVTPPPSPPLRCSSLVVSWLLCGVGCVGWFWVDPLNPSQNNNTEIYYIYIQGSKILTTQRKSGNYLLYPTNPTYPILNVSS